MGTSVKELLNHYADYKEHNSEPKSKNDKKESISDDEELEYIPETTVTRSGRVSRKPN